MTDNISNNALRAAMIDTAEQGVVSEVSFRNAFIAYAKVDCDDALKVYVACGIAVKLSPERVGVPWSVILAEGEKIRDMKGRDSKDKKLVSGQTKRNDEQHTIWEAVKRTGSNIIWSPASGIKTDDERALKSATQKANTEKARISIASSAEQAANDVAQKIVMGAVDIAPVVNTTLDVLQFGVAERNRLAKLLHDNASLELLCKPAYDVFVNVLSLLSTLPTPDEQKAVSEKLAAEKNAAEQKAAIDHANALKAAAIETATQKATERKAAEQKAAEAELAARIAAAESAKAMFAAEKAAEQKPAARKVRRSRK